MEFNFRSFDDRPSSSQFSSPSNFSFFTQQAIRAGFTGPGPGPDPMQHHRAPMQRELEKERIRAEIIAEEIVRRRILEEEVRREMMMEREMALRFGPTGSGPNPGPMRFEPRLPPLLTNFENREGFRVGVSPHREVGFRGGQTLPFQRDPVVAGTGNGNSSGVTLQEIKGSVSEVNKDKVIILAKPNPNAAELKRKATTPLGGADVELTSVGFKKAKTKDDWSCALCRITATSERGLNEHLQGKKHKARERGMVAQRTGFGVGPLPAKTANTSKHIKVPRKTTTSFGKKGEIVEGKSSAKVDENPAQKTPGAEDTLLQKKERSVEKKENGEAATPAIKPAIVKPKKFRFWCEICHVGAFSQNVMNAHQRGKRHLAQLNQNGEPTPEIKSAQNGAAQAKKKPEVAAEEKKEPEVAAEEKKEPEVVIEEKKEQVAAEKKKESEVAVEEEKEPEVAAVAVDEMKEPEVAAVEEMKEPDVAAVEEMKEPDVAAVEEMKEPDVAAVEEIKEPDVATVEIKQETVAEQVESKEGSVDNNVPRAEDKNKVIENAGDVMTEQDTNQVPSSNEGVC